MMKKAMMFALIAAAAVSGIAPVLSGQTADEVKPVLSGYTPAGINPSVAQQSAGYITRYSADIDSVRQFALWAELPAITTFVNADGSISVCAGNTANTYIYEYSADMKLLKTLRFKNVLAQLGAFTKDSAGNYYFFYAEEVGAKESNRENMAIVKYDRTGKQQKVFKLKAFPDQSFYGIQKPFVGGICRLEVSGSMIGVYFAREMFLSPQDGQNHQAVYGFVLDKDSFVRLDKGAPTDADGAGFMLMPYASHSFNQFILPINGGFIFADHSDAYPRAFTFAKFQQGKDTKRLHAFRFEGKIGDNVTNAEMGGLAKTPQGYIFAGTLGKSNDNLLRNLFILTFDENMTACSKPVFITNYTQASNQTAAFPKIAALDAGRYLLLWETSTLERREEVPGGMRAIYPSKHSSTFMITINEQGKALSAPKELPQIRLNMHDTLRYNQQTKKVYWSTEGHLSVATFALDPDKPVTLKPGDMEFAAGIGDYAAIMAGLKLPANPIEDFIFTIEGAGSSRYVKITDVTPYKRHIVFPEKIDGIPVTTIGKYAADIMRGMSYVYILPEGLTAIEERAFNNSDITDIIIPAAVKSVGKDAFSYCDKLASVTILGSPAIEPGAFQNCPNLKSVSIAQSVTNVGAGAFYNCPSLTAVSRAEIVRRFGENVFANPQYQPPPQQTTPPSAGRGGASRERGR